MSKAAEQFARLASLRDAQEQMKKFAPIIKQNLRVTVRLDEAALTGIGAAKDREAFAQAAARIELTVAAALAAYGRSAVDCAMIALAVEVDDQERACADAAGDELRRFVVL